MAQHYPIEPGKSLTTPSPELTFESVSIPGSEEEYNVEAILDVEDVIDEGELVDAEVVKAQSAFGSFISEYEDDSDTLEVFLGYAENDWGSEQMWRNTDHSRGELYESTEVLEEEYGLIETEYGDVNLTQKGHDVYDAFEILSENE